MSVAGAAIGSQGPCGRPFRPSPHNSCQRDEARRQKRLLISCYLHFGLVEAACLDVRGSFSCCARCALCDAVHAGRHASSRWLTRRGGRLWAKALRGHHSALPVAGALACPYRLWVRCIGGAASSTAVFPVGRMTCAATGALLGSMEPVVPPAVDTRACADLLMGERVRRPERDGMFTTPSGTFAYLNLAVSASPDTRFAPGTMLRLLMTIRLTACSGRSCRYTPASSKFGDERSQRRVHLSPTR
jgi:hypothetical protein